MASTDDGAETSSTPRKRVKRTPGDDMAYHPPDTLSPSSSVPHRFTVRAEVAALPNRPVQPLSPPASSPRATTRARWTNRLIGSPSPTKVPLQDALATMIERSKSRPGPPTTTTPFRTLFPGGGDDPIPGHRQRAREPGDTSLPCRDDDDDNRDGVRM